MTGTDLNIGECLFLYKDNENEIYVDNSQNLKEHQIASLRFLYRQFKKKKNGAVLNFPPGSGKSLVVTLFLNAIRSQLEERVLILCADDEEIYHWKHLLLTWTNYKSDEIAVESSNPRVKKIIFLKKAEDLTSYLRCHWGVAVIKDENICKILQKVVLEVDLKIWITSTDIKKDLSLLLFIYNWMFPKSNVDINELILSQDKPQDNMVQTIIMDAVLEDFVIRENKVKVIRETKNSQVLKTYRDNNQKGTTRKNKDITGSKIKKSKRNIEDITPMEQTIHLPADICNRSNEELKEEPQPDVSDNDLPDMENNKSCERDINLKIETVKVENDSIISVHINHTPTVKTERNTEEPLDFKQAVDDNVDALTVKTEKNTEEPVDFKHAVDDNVNENNVTCAEENATESLDFEAADKNSNSTASLDFEDEDREIITDNKNVLSIDDETCSYDIEHLDNNKSLNENDIKMDLEATEKSEIGRNDIDTKMSELEERTLKKFKGSLLDSLF